ncbi:hypothetical protein Gohar_008673, partial [Gossypium harknessii]|nr:hypothetical protein [Gossypium harknessii]
MKTMFVNALDVDGIDQDHSLEDALEYNTKYAKQEDFGIQGYRDKKYIEKEDKVQELLDETRVGYKALIYVSKKDDNKWIRAQRNLIDALDDSGICPSKIMSVLANETRGIDMLSEKASRAQKHEDVAIGGLKRLFEELDALKIEDEKISSIDILRSMNSLKDIDPQNIILHDPSHVTTKGCPRSLRMKRALEQ